MHRLLLLTALVACQDSQVSALPLDPICGVDGPIAMLELDDDDDVFPVSVSGTDDVLVHVVPAQRPSYSQIPRCSSPTRTARSVPRLNRPWSVAPAGAPPVR